MKFSYFIPFHKPQAEKFQLKVEDFHESRISRRLTYFFSSDQGCQLYRTVKGQIPTRKRPNYEMVFKKAKPKGQILSLFLTNPSYAVLALYLRP